MKHMVLLAIAAVLVAAPAYATYDEALAQCQKFAADNKTSADPCVCIAKAIGDDAALLKEEQSVKTLDDFDAASDAYHAAVNPCLPPDQQVK